MQSEEKLFQNPTAEYRGKPFWAWNGLLEKEELLRQIDVFSKMGFGGFFMHSRTGLETEYLGKEWMEATADCIQYAQRKGMEAWLYDEDRWPSGCAGGMATKEHAYRQSFLQVEISDTAQWKENTIAVFACEMDDGCIVEKRRLLPEEQPKEGESVLTFSIEEASCNDVYNGNTYLDTMNREATEYFIELTHEKYRKELSAEDFHSVSGIFTDEPHRGPLFTNFSGGSETRAPYTPKLFEAFTKKYGYDLKEYLPELFLENFAKPVLEWCHKNRMALTGHVLHEDSLTAQTAMQGSLMRFYEYMDIPGIDHLGSSNVCYWIVKQVVSVAKQLKKPKILSELYGVTGWNATLETYKEIGDWQALFGINLRCPHLCWYTMKGEAKRDYPASIFYHLAGWKEFHYLEDYFSRIHVFLERGKEQEELLVISPVESVWARACSGAFDGLDARDSLIREIEEKYRELFWILTSCQIGFDYGDEGLMEEHASVEDAFLRIGSCRYRQVAVCGMRTMRSTTLKLLREFQNAGGTLIFIGEIPEYVDVEPSEEVKGLAERAVCVPFERHAIAKAVEKSRILSLEGEGFQDILVCRRAAEGERRYMLLNKNTKERREGLKLFFADAACVEEWDARTGRITKRPEESAPDGGICIKVDFAPEEEKLFRVLTYINKEETAVQENSRDEAAEEYIALPDSYAYRLSEKNICVLDMVQAAFQTPDGKEHCLGPMEVLWADREFRKAHQMPPRGGEMLQPWYKTKISAGREQPRRAVLRYSFDVEQVPEEAIGLVLENAAHIHEIRLNEQIVPVNAPGCWLDTCFQEVELPAELFIPGFNEIAIEQDFLGQDGFEAVYLRGNFAVSFREKKYPVIGRLPEALTLGDVTRQGLPFYSGTVSYLLPHEENYQGRLEISAEAWRGWTLSVVDGKGKETFLGFAPYSACCDGLREIRLFLTRKNTFGPLHKTDPNPSVCGPESFLTTGEDWSEEYVLLEQGLMENPVVKRLQNLNKKNQIKKNQ